MTALHAGSNTGSKLREPPVLADAPPTLGRHRGTSVLRFLLPADVLACLAGLAAGQVIYPGPASGRVASLLAALVYLPVFIVVMAAYGMYRRGKRRLVGSSFPDLGTLAHSTIVGVLIVTVASRQFGRWSGLPRPATRCVVLAGLLIFVLVPIARMIARIFSQSLRISRVLVIGSGHVAKNVVQRIAATPGLELVGCVDDNEFVSKFTNHFDTQLLGGLGDVDRIVDEHNIDHVVVAFSPVNESRVAALLRVLADRVQISVVPRMFDLLTVRSSVEDFAGLAVIDVAPPALGPSARFTKRTLDVVLSGILLMATTPLFVTLAVLVRATSPGPALFRQQRAGRGGRAFQILKFRTMRVGAEDSRRSLSEFNDADGPLFKLHEDERTTQLGRFLRRTSLDELPQLYNVLVGHMSLVGPRPFILSESSEIDGWAARRYEVRPGITGLWQVSGRSDLPYDELRRLDYCYVASWSLGWDLRILWHTPASVLRRRGAY